MADEIRYLLVATYSTTPPLQFQFLLQRKRPAMAKIIDGKAIAKSIRDDLATEVKSLHSNHNLVPGLAVVIVGTDKDSQVYVSMKKKACAEASIRSFDIDCPSPSQNQNSWTRSASSMPTLMYTVFIFCNNADTLWNLEAWLQTLEEGMMQAPFQAVLVQDGMRMGPTLLLCN